MAPKSALVDKALANNGIISYNGSWECLPPSKRLWVVLFTQKFAIKWIQLTLCHEEMTGTLSFVPPSPLNEEDWYDFTLKNCTQTVTMIQIKSLLELQQFAYYKAM